MTQRAPSRRQREKEEVQRRILDAARELFAAVGYEAVTMRQIAERIEYTPTAIYFHFRDKGELFRRLCQEDFGKLEARFKVLARVGDPVERLRMLSRAYVAFALDHPNHYRLLHMTAAPEATGLEEAPAADREAFRALERGIQEVAKGGALREAFAGDPDLAAQTLWAALHGVVSLEIGRRDGAGIDWRPAGARTEAAIDMALGGLLRDGR